MQKYQSIKTVEAEPMDRLEAEGRGLVRDITDTNEAGYYVLYSDGYGSWSPKDVFEKGYILIQEDTNG